MVENRAFPAGHCHKILAIGGKRSPSAGAARRIGEKASLDEGVRA
jgi:hypothetical protein